MKRFEEEHPYLFILVILILCWAIIASLMHWINSDLDDAPGRCAQPGCTQEVLSSSFCSEHDPMKNKKNTTGSSYSITGTAQKQSSSNQSEISSKQNTTPPKQNTTSPNQSTTSQSTGMKTETTKKSHTQSYEGYDEPEDYAEDMADEYFVEHGGDWDELYEEFYDELEDEAAFFYGAPLCYSITLIPDLLPKFSDFPVLL